MNSAAQEYDGGLKSIDGELADVQRRLEALYDALETGKMHLDDLAPRIRELRDRKDLLSRMKIEGEDTLSHGKVDLLDRHTVLVYLDSIYGVLSKAR